MKWPTREFLECPEFERAWCVTCPYEDYTMCVLEPSDVACRRYAERESLEQALDNLCEEFMGDECRCA